MLLTAMVRYALFGLLISFSISGFSQVQTKAIKVDQETVIKDSLGRRVTLVDAVSMINTGDWTLVEEKDESGHIMRLRATTPKEKQAILKRLGGLSGHAPVGLSGAVSKEKAPNFSVKDLHGVEYDLERLRGKVIVLNFWFIACKPCVQEIPELNELYEEFRGDTNVVFLSFTFDEADQVSKFLEKNTFSYPVAVKQNSIIELYKIEGFPTNLIIDREGRFYRKYMGGFSGIGKLLSGSVRDVLDGKASKPNGPNDKVHSLMITPDTKFKDSEGKDIPYHKALEMLESKRYKIVLSDDKDEEKHFILRLKGE